MGNFLKVLTKKYGGIQACLGPSDPLIGFGRTTVNPGSVRFLFGHRNTWTGNGNIVVNLGCVGACLGPRNPLSGFGKIALKSKEAWLFFCETHIHA